MMNEEITMQNVTFIAASEGRVQFFVEDVHVGEGATAKELADVIKFQSLNVYNAHCSSSMDFADEEGFEAHDGAYKLLEAALEIVEG
jgi:hypothetical protein